MNLKIHIIRPLCPYCEKAPVIKNATCGKWYCQWKHHIFTMRKKRKTDRIHPTRRII